LPFTTQLRKRFRKRGDEVKKVFKKVCITNDVGGTEYLPEGRYEVEIEEEWDDYETGIHYKGKLVRKTAINRARKAGTTGYKLEHYASRYGSESEIAKSAAKAAKEFDPATVYASEFDEIK